MRRTLIFLFVALTFLSIPVHATERIAGSSAMLVSHIHPQGKAKVDVATYITKNKAIANVLKRYDSPLRSSTHSFVATCTKYNLDCYLLPAIAGLESTYGQFIWPESYNPFGWGGGYIMFGNWAQAIDTVGHGLRFNYVNKGAQDVAQIGRIYSESPTWAVRVERLMRDFETEEIKVRLQTGNLAVEL